MGDLTIFYLALIIALITRQQYPLSISTWDAHFWPFTIFFFLWLANFFINGFYDLKISYNNGSLLNNIFKLSLINFIVAIVGFYFAAPWLGSIKPQTTLVILTLIAAGMLFGWRKLFYNIIKSEAIANNVLILGNSDLAQLLNKEINSRKQLGYRANIIEDIPENLKQYCIANNINIIVPVMDIKNHQDLAKRIFECLAIGVSVYNLPLFYEQITATIPIDHIDQFWFLENLSENSKKSYDVIKRGLDIFFSIIGIIIALPFLPIIVTIIKLESAGSAFFTQIRTGKNGKPFLALKFRSMIKDAEKNGAQWATKNDARITKFGSFMRKTRLDEIPQLINVLRGELSFVGPRPERPEFIEILSQKIPYYKERLLAKPGLTGWAQLNGPAYGGSEAESKEKVKYDLFYVKNRSLWLDASILLKTIKIVLSGKGQ
ncbi:MAG: sugar transferase [bacterium]